MDIYDYINDLYDEVNELDNYFDYDDDDHIYQDNEKDKWYEDTIITIKYQEDEYYFTPDFYKVKYDKDKARYYYTNDDPEYVQNIKFKFPTENSQNIILKDNLNLSYDQIHNLVIKKAINLAVKFIQSYFIDNNLTEINSLRKKNKELIKLTEQLQMSVMELRDTNEFLHKRLNKLEKLITNNDKNIEKPNIEGKTTIKDSIIEECYIDRKATII
jgi:hypothetical protein